MYDNDTLKDIQVSKTAQRSLLSHAFLYMFFGLLITAVVATGLGFLFSNLIANATTSVDKQTISNAITGVTVGSGIALLIMIIAIEVVFLKGKHSIVAPGIVFAVLMGALLSSFVTFIDWKLLATAFGISAAAFGVMALIGILSKGNLSMLGIIASGLLFGSLIICLVNLITALVTRTVVPGLYWAVEFGIFAAMILITIFDINRIKEISQQGEFSTNLALYCALTLYVDFIYIFVKVVYFLVLANRN